jgi:hypothetical protein
MVYWLECCVSLGVAVFTAWKFIMLKEKSKKITPCQLSLKEQKHYLYQDNYYNSVKAAEALLDEKTGVCGTIQCNRGLPFDLHMKAKQLHEVRLTFQRKKASFCGSVKIKGRWG